VPKKVATKKPVEKMDHERININEAKPHPENVNRHSEVNIATIMRSLQEFGQQKPIVLNQKGYVIAGNGTLKAMKRLGRKTVFIVRSTLSPEKEMAYLIADNKTSDLSEFDYEALSDQMKILQQGGIDLATTGFQDFELEPLLEAEWSPPEMGALPGGEDGMVTIKITKPAGEILQKALTVARSYEGYEKATDEEALVCILTEWTNQNDDA